ncbi:MAG: prepilin-type N-terminal cleavage/methylation domain-containing protein [Acidobacteria bacterium]|nr:prepilin-type N-terminal cleavage/methylation domain-containing protein [Acidobacteriota bacterium]
MRTFNGFTLVELMIAIVVAGVLMTMAAFALVRARASANEVSALASLKAVNQGQLAYSAACGRGFYAPSLTVLGTPPQGATVGYLDPQLATGTLVQHNGYFLRIEMGAGGAAGPLTDCNGTTPVTAYYATAVPVAAGNSGTRAFATNQAGAIWQRADSVAPTEPFGPPAQIAE